LDRTGGGQSLGQHLEILADPARQWTIEEIAGIELGTRFAPVRRAVPLLGIGDGALWLRFALRNAEVHDTEWLLEIDRPDLRAVAIYHRTDAGDWVRRETGTSLPFATREFKTQSYLFRLEIPPQEQTYYLRIEADRSGILPISIWPPDDFFGFDRQRQLGLGLFYGCIAVMTIFNLILYFGLRDTSYLFSVFYMGSSLFGWVIDSGAAFEYLWPELAGWNNRILFAAICINELSFLVFTQSFLMTQVHTPRLHRAITVLAGLFATVMVVPLATDLKTGFLLNAMLAPALLVIWLWTGALCWRRGYAPGRLFLLAGCSTIVGIILNIFMRQGLLPLVFWTQYGGHLGWVCTGFLISIGLAVRINHLRRERQQQETRAHDQQFRAEALAAENERRSEEFEHARNLQQGFLPTELPDLPYLEVAAYQRSATEVGGDYYDFFPQDNGALCGAIGDASGHGISAGLIVACAKTALLAATDVAVEERSTVVNALLEQVTFGQRMFMAMLLFKLEREVSSEAVEAWFTGAGIPPAYVLRADGAVEEILVAGLPLGMVVDRSFETATCRLFSGDRLVFMTDGLPERPNADAEQMGYERLTDALAEIAGRPATAAATLDQVMAIGEQWAQGSKQDDDETSIVIAVR